MKEFTMYLLHAIFTWLPWTVLCLAMFITNRWFAHVSDKMQYIHAFLGWLVMILTLAFVFLLFVFEGWDVDDLHQIIGFSVTVVSVYMVGNGIATYYVKNESRWNSQQKIKLMRQTHKILGFMSFFAGAITIWLGFEEWNGARNLKFLGPLNLVLSIVLFLGFEANFQLMKDREDAFPTDGYPIISEAEFNIRVRKGENLCILDNLVLDLTNYVHQHPGGAFLIT